MLRTLVRDKANLVAESGDWLRRMQKSLDQMSVRVHRAVSDIDGVTGMAILRAIAGGERDAQKLAKFRNARCSKTEQEIEEQLNGRWREDHVFSLQQGLKMYDAVQERIVAYEQEILRRLGEMDADEPPQPTAPPLQNTNKAKAIKKRGQEAKRQALYRMSGVDMTQIDAVGGGNSRSRAQRIRPRFEHLPHGEAVRLSRHPGAACAPKRSQAGATARALVWQRLCAWRPCPYAIARRSWDRIIEESRNAAGEILLSSLPPGSWPLLFTDCCDGVSHTSTKVQPHTKTAIANTASHVWPPQPNNSATS